MPDDDQAELEARIRAEVDRSVAPYEGVAPPFMLAKLRELAERYWRENPVAVRALQLQVRRSRTRSGVEEAAAAEDAAPAGEDAKKEAWP